MCNCIKELEKEMIDIEFNNRKVIKAELVSAALMFSTGKIHTCSVVELTLEGQKKKGIQNMIHTYCPFCGEKYPEL